MPTVANGRIYRKMDHIITLDMAKVRTTRSFLTALLAILPGAGNVCADQRKKVHDTCRIFPYCQFGLCQ